MDDRGSAWVVNTGESRWKPTKSSAIRLMGFTVVLNYGYYCDGRTALNHGGGMRCPRLRGG